MAPRPLVGGRERRMIQRIFTAKSTDVVDVACPPPAYERDLKLVKSLSTTCTIIPPYPAGY